MDDPQQPPGSPSLQGHDSAEPGHGGALHRRAWDAMPWVLAGTASADDVLCVESHLAHCADCRAEWALQERIRSGLEGSLPARLPAPDLAWQRLQARLQLRPEPGDAAAERQAAPAGPPAASTPPRLTRWLVAAVLVQSVGLAALGTAWWARADADGDYRTLSRPAAAPPAASVRLVLAPGMDFGALRLLLASTRMMAVEVGPDGSSLGLAAVDGDPRTVAAALPALRTAPAVMLAEPIAVER
jgi:hypothetical protein